jgi:hypothetical protein
MAATKNLSDKPLHVHDPQGNVHMIPTGCLIPEWATPQIKMQSLAITYANEPLRNPPEPQILVGPAYQRTYPKVSYDGRPEPELLNRPLEQEADEGVYEPEKYVDVHDLDDETREERYHEELAALEAKYGRGIG